MKRKNVSSAEKALDREIDAIYRENCANIQIDIMAIPSIFAEAKRARAAGRDMKEAIIAYVNSIRRN